MTRKQEIEQFGNVGAIVRLHVDVFSRKLSGSDFRVLVAIAAHADKNGTARPSVSALSEMTAMSERSVLRVLANLENEGLVSRKKNSIRNVYIIAPAPGVENRRVVEVIWNV